MVVFSSGRLAVDFDGSGEFANRQATTFSVACCCTASGMLVCVYFRKPGASTVREYIPAAAPSWHVATGFIRQNHVRNVSFGFGERHARTTIAAPLRSVTVPRTEAV